MIKVVELPFGCSLWGDQASGHPTIRTRYGWKTPEWVAVEFPSVDSRDVFRALKRYLDQKDAEWTSPGLELRWKAADLAKFSMERALRSSGRWSDDLRDNEVIRSVIYG